MLKKAFIALFALLPALSGQSEEKKDWFTLQACRYLADRSNDGASFLVHCGQQKFFVRLYFVDAPETAASFPERVRQQYEYFGVTLDELTRAGARARDVLASRIRHGLATRRRVDSVAPRSCQGCRLGGRAPAS